jgi:hypothetical protein
VIYKPRAREMVWHNPRIGPQKALWAPRLTMSDVAAAKGTTQVELKTGNHVLANVTGLNKQRETILHLLNYDAKPAENLKIKLSLGQRYQDLAEKSHAVLSPNGFRDLEERAMGWKCVAGNISLL